MKHFFLILFCITICSSSIFAQKALHLYGGKNNNIYLGCFNCDKLDLNSIWNEMGTYGSSFDEKSIWNDSGKYGGEFSDYSPFNSLALYPPAIMDKDGGFYGYLTTNSLTVDRADFKLASTIYKNWKEIKRNVSKWYDHYFQ